MISNLEAFNAELQAAQVECDVIDAELSSLEHGDPAAPDRYFYLIDRRRLIGERLLAAVEALGSSAPLAPTLQVVTPQVHHHFQRVD